MATRAVRFLAITPLGPADPYALEPAPNVTDWDHIQEALEGVPVLTDVNALREGIHAIRGSYRSWTMYLYPNVRFYRDNPKTHGGNGFAGDPPVGLKEEVTIRMDGQQYAAHVEYI